MAATYASTVAAGPVSWPVAELLGRAPLGRALVAEPLGRAPLGRALVAEPLGRALTTGAALEASEFTPVEVLPDDSPGTSGAVPIGAPVHPARTIMAAPARTAVTDPCLLMKLPPSWESRQRPKARLDALSVKSLATRVSAPRRSTRHGDKALVDRDRTERLQSSPRITRRRIVNGSGVKQVPHGGGGLLSYILNSGSDANRRLAAHLLVVGRVAGHGSGRDRPSTIFAHPGYRQSR